MRPACRHTPAGHVIHTPPMPCLSDSPLRPARLLTRSQDSHTCPTLPLQGAAPNEWMHLSATLPATAKQRLRTLSRHRPGACARQCQWPRSPMQSCNMEGPQAGGATLQGEPAPVPRTPEDTDMRSGCSDDDGFGQGKVAARPCPFIQTLETCTLGGGTTAGSLAWATHSLPTLRSWWRR